MPRPHRESREANTLISLAQRERARGEGNRSGHERYHILRWHEWHDQLVPRKSARRRLWYRVHLWLGLLAGTLLVLISLSGSLIVFAWSIDAWLNRDVMRVTPGKSFRPLGEIVAAARSVLSTGADIGAITFPREPDGVFRVSYTDPRSGDGFEVFVDPYTAAVSGHRLWGDFERCCSWHGPVMAVIYRFHDSFLLGEAGLITVGATGLLMLLALVSGLVLWWPRPGRWGRALTIRRGGSRQRFIFDLHNVIGVWSLPLLAVLFFTGTYLSFPDQARRLVGHFSPLATGTAVQACKSSRHVPPDLDGIIAIADELLPGDELDWIAVPEHGSGTYEIYKRDDRQVMPSRTLRRVTIDARTGCVLSTDDRTRRSGGDLFDEWQLGLHSGEAFGLAGQILVLLAGLVPPLLYATGLMRWLQKRNAAKAAARMRGNKSSMPSSQGEI